MFAINAIDELFSFITKIIGYKRSENEHDFTKYFKDRGNKDVKNYYKSTDEKEETSVLDVIFVATFFVVILMILVYFVLILVLYCKRNQAFVKALEGSEDGYGDGLSLIDVSSLVKKENNMQSLKNKKSLRKRPTLQFLLKNMHKKMSVREFDV